MDSNSTNPARVLGLAGWSGSGKTTLLVKLLPLLTRRGLRVSTIKHAHHDFDIDIPGKDSYEHRKAGASEVIVSSARRWVQLHEIGNEPELRLSQLLRRISPCDLIIVEGFKGERHPKIEVFRSSVDRPPLYHSDSHIVAIASDREFPGASVAVVDLNNVAAIADVVYSQALPLDAVIAMLENSANDGPTL